MRQRFHALRVNLIGLLLTSATYFSAYWLVHDATSLQIWWCVNQCSLAVYLVSGFLRATNVLSREKFGQFMSANTAIGYIGLITLHPLIGRLLEALKDYRSIFLISGTLAGLSATASCLLILAWRKRNPPASSPAGNGVVP